ncbi:MAG: 30S ribosomal protein S18 [Patescibacteria group bacterium]|nr:30S ribosomal protein S18 [Patescibacteria group bacterium]
MFRKSYRAPKEKFRQRKQKNCVFCDKKTEPDYKDIAQLKTYLSERGKIVPYYRSGLCSKHQKRLALAVKRARFLALIPFVA